MKKKIVIVSILLILLVFGGIYGKNHNPSLSEDGIIALSKIWSYAKDYYACWELTDEDLDWDLEYQNAVDRMKNAKSEYEVMCILDEFRALLKDGHGDLYIPFSRKDLFGILPFGMDYIENQYVICETLDPAQFPMGSVVEEINDMPAALYLEYNIGKQIGLFTPIAREYRCGQRFVYGERGKKVKITISKADGTRSTKKVSWQNRTEKMERRQYREIGDAVYQTDMFSVFRSEEGICHVISRSFHSMDVLTEFQSEVLPLIKDSNGVILDLRYNQGGNSMVGKGILRSFYSGNLPELKAKTPIKMYEAMAYSYVFGEEMREKYQGYAEVYEEDKEFLDPIVDYGQRMYEGKFVITASQYRDILNILEVPELSESSEVSETYQAAEKPDPESADVPCVILINHKSGSAVDSTAAMAKSAGFPLIGTRTNGATGNIAVFDLNNGYRFVISTGYDFTPEGEAINNHGIDATIYVEQTLDDERNGIDSQLEYANKYLLK